MPNVAGRNSYTRREDEELVKYIAQEKPTLAGRTGNLIYQNLEEHPEKYPWAKQHSWQSWRERYRKNQDKFNIKIANWQKETRKQAAGLADTSKDKQRERVKAKPESSAKASTHATESRAKPTTAQPTHRRVRASPAIAGPSKPTLPVMIASSPPAVPQPPPKIKPRQPPPVYRLPPSTNPEQLVPETSSDDSSDSSDDEVEDQAPIPLDDIMRELFGTSEEEEEEEEEEEDKPQGSPSASGSDESEEEEEEESEAIILVPNSSPLDSEGNPRPDLKEPPQRNGYRVPGAYIVASSDRPPQSQPSSASKRSPQAHTSTTQGHRSNRLGIHGTSVAPSQPRPNSKQYASPPHHVRQSSPPPLPSSSTKPPSEPKQRPLLKRKAPHTDSDDDSFFASENSSPGASHTKNHPGRPVPPVPPNLAPPVYVQTALRGELRRRGQEHLRNVMSSDDEETEVVKKVWPPARGVAKRVAKGKGKEGGSRPADVEMQDVRVNASKGDESRDDHDRDRDAKRRKFVDDRQAAGPAAPVAAPQPAPSRPPPDPREPTAAVQPPHRLLEDPHRSGAQPTPAEIRVQSKHDSATRQSRPIKSPLTQPQAPAPAPLAAIKRKPEHQRIRADEGPRKKRKGDDPRKDTYDVFHTAPTVPFVVAPATSDQQSNGVADVHHNTEDNVPQPLSTERFVDLLTKDSDQGKSGPTSSTKQPKKVDLHRESLHRRMKKTSMNHQDVVHALGGLSRSASGFTVTSTSLYSRASSASGSTSGSGSGSSRLRSETRPSSDAPPGQRRRSSTNRLSFSSFDLGLNPSHEPPSTPLSRHITSPDDLEACLAVGFQFILSKMAKSVGFEYPGVLRLYKVTKDLNRTFELLQQMRKHADEGLFMGLNDDEKMALEQLVEKEREKEEKERERRESSHWDLGDVGEEENLERNMGSPSAIQEVLSEVEPPPRSSTRLSSTRHRSQGSRQAPSVASSSPAAPTPPRRDSTSKVVLLQSNSAPRSRPSFVFKRLSPGHEQALEEHYSPPEKSRAGQFARLSRQGREDEAKERELRRASGGVPGLTPFPSTGRRSVKDDGNRDVEMASPTPAGRRDSEIPRSDEAEPEKQEEDVVDVDAGVHDGGDDAVMEEDKGELLFDDVGPSPSSERGVHDRTAPEDEEAQDPWESEEDKEEESQDPWESEEDKEEESQVPWVDEEDEKEDDKLFYSSPEQSDDKPETHAEELGDADVEPSDSEEEEPESSQLQPPPPAQPQHSVHPLNRPLSPPPSYPLLTSSEETNHAPKIRLTDKETSTFVQRVLKTRPLVRESDRRELQQVDEAYKRLVDKAMGITFKQEDDGDDAILTKSSQEKKLVQADAMRELEDLEKQHDPDVVRFLSMDWIRGQLFGR